MGGDTPDGIIPRLNAQLFSEVQVTWKTEVMYPHGSNAVVGDWRVWLVPLGLHMLH